MCVGASSLRAQPWCSDNSERWLLQLGLAADVSRVALALPGMSCWEPGRCFALDKRNTDAVLWQGSLQRLEIGTFPGNSLRFRGARLERILLLLRFLRTVLMICKGGSCCQVSL